MKSKPTVSGPAGGMVNSRTVHLSRAKQEGPLYHQLAIRLEEMVRSQSLRAGDRMPSVRQFSTQQGVSVPTALQAYATLESRGLIEARPKSGFYVRARRADTVPEPTPSAISLRVSPTPQMDPVSAILSDHGNSTLVPFGAALPSPALLPGLKLARTMAAISRKLGPSSVNYDTSPGNETLRRELARRSIDWGCALKMDDLLLTVGATEALSLALRSTCNPGDTVAIESPTYFGLPAMLRELRLNALPIPVHCADGIDLETLERALRTRRVAACVVVPNIQNPIGLIMPDDRKRQLVKLCLEHKVALIEDDTYGDLQHEGRRPRCLKAFDPDGSVILCGSYSKKLAPGYRIGYVAAGRWQSSILALKQATTLSGPLLPALAVAEFLKNGGYDRYLRSVRQSYRQQVATMREAIVETFPEGICLSRPKGGFLLWCELPARVDAIELFKQARNAGISIAPGPMFSSTGQFRNFIRINCGHPWSPAIERAIGVLGHLAHKQIKG